MPGIGAEILATCRGATYGRFVLDPVPGSLGGLAAQQVAVILVGQDWVQTLANQVRVSG